MFATTSLILEGSRLGSWGTSQNLNLTYDMNHLLRKILLSWLGFAMSCQLLSAQEGEKEGTWFHFDAKPFGGRLLEGYEVEIGASGATKVSRKVFQKEALEYRTDLSADEVTFLKTLIRSTNFFELPENVDEPKSSHPTHISLTVKLENQSRSLNFQDIQRPSLKPVRMFVWRLVEQARVHDVLVNGAEDTSGLNYSPRLTEAKVLQSNKFREPLKARIRAVKNGEDSRSDLRNLA